MKKSLARSFASVGVCVGLLLVAPGAGAAGFRHSQRGTTVTSLKATLNPHKAYRQALATYIAERSAIAEAFKNAVNAAQASFVEALASSTTAAQRSTARAAYDLAIAQAAAARSSALISLGNPPSRPS